MASQERSMPFIKNLASSDRKIRTSALASLHRFLSARHISAALTPLDILKLWKGLFFSLWMCDRAMPQQTLCNELADLVFVLPRKAVVPWLKGFWSTMSREWTGIDVLRMEKFLLLVRRVVGASFMWMKGAAGSSSASADASWDAERVNDILTLLGEWPFALDEELRPGIVDDTKDAQNQQARLLAPRTIPVGLKLHVLDVWVDEVEKVGMLKEDDEEAAKILQRITELVDILEQRTVSPAVRVRSKESLADKRLSANITQAEAGKVGDKDVNMAEFGVGGSWDGFDD
ncbi:nucleolar protein,Nop52-domain-containing protein [Apodospora peruviana]|uniref:Nucleolar protein,Nop52-domain-containing protein n=1 Tax=Apodospora peruviana TaxID=516989 RepID=A0AAE0I3T0_9PEZI|nr:nucleolar protein,Nop52-domain-containing protein [Apodospora peruviana]